MRRGVRICYHDNTYNLVTLRNFELNVGGTTDAGQQHHPMWLALVDGKHTGHCLAVLSDVKEAMIRNRIQFPNIAVTDNDAGSMKAWKRAFPEVCMGNGHFHMKQHVKRSKEKVRPFSTKHRLRDIVRPAEGRPTWNKAMQKFLSLIASTPTPTEHTEMLSDFRREILPSQPAMRSFFNSHVKGDRKNWGGGCLPASAGPNDSFAESFNSALKNEQLAGGPRDVKDFLRNLEGGLRVRSQEAKGQTPLHPLHITPSASQKTRARVRGMWRDGAAHRDFLRDECHELVTWCTSGDLVWAVIPSLTMRGRAPDDIQAALWNYTSPRAREEPLFDYLLRRADAHKTTMKKTSDPTHGGLSHCSCTCEQFLSCGACKHDIGVSLFQGLVKTPPEMDERPLRQEGRRS